MAVDKQTLLNDIDNDLADYSTIRAAEHRGILKEVVDYVDATKLPLTGGTMTGNINFNTTDTGITWAMNTDGAYIKFFNTGDGDTNSRLEYRTSDNGDEYHRWVIFNTERMNLKSTGLTVTGDVSATSFTGAGTGLTGTASSLNIGGNAATATKLQTARNINGVSFDGSANITIADSTRLPLAGGTMTGAISFAAGQTWPTFNQNTTGNAATATKLATARNIGGVSFDGSANINLPGVNQAGTQDTSGNAATATKLATARNIGGVSFDGSANINLPGVNQAGTQNTSGNAATATLAANASNAALLQNLTAVDVANLATVAGAFNNPGYLTFRNGLTIQWGKVSLTYSADSSNTIQFNTTFTTVLSVVATSQLNGTVSGDNRGGGAIKSNSETTTGFTWLNDSMGDYGVYYIAVGYIVTP